MTAALCPALAHPSCDTSRFQPLTRGFHEAAGEHIREVLEKALMQHTVLTEGDVVRVDCAPGKRQEEG